MSRILLLALLLCLALTPAPAFLPYQFYWDQDTNDLSPDLSWNIWSTNDLTAPVNQWPLFTNVAYTNLTATNSDVTGASRFYLPFTAPTAGRKFFFMTASNAFMRVESAPTAVTNTPSLHGALIHLTR